jgi:hypothetical protein
LELLDVGVANHKFPLLISYCFVALFFIFCHGQNIKKGYVHNVMHVLVPNCGQGFELPNSRSFFLNLNSFYFDAFVAKATI